ncbi:MAG: hypothetical protein QM619_08350 [Micropruina sp.]|uniref:hypothetical protein n=1 Tax=Micropruina sp. TaxID=2737536 RepID=UPI0039E5D711
MSFRTIVDTLGPVVRRGSAAFLAFPVAGVVAPSYAAVQLAAEIYLDDSAK